MHSASAVANASSLIERNLEAGRGGKLAIIAEDGERISYADLGRAVCRVASRLRQLGVRREDRVVLVLDDTLAFPAAFLGAMRIGAVPIPCNFLARAGDFAYFLDDSYARVAIVDAAFIGKVGPAVREREDVSLVISGAAGSAESLDEWLRDGDDELDPAAVHDQDMAFWLYSSGSTGAPKGVVHSHRDLWATCETYGKHVLDSRPGDVHFSTTKLFHAYGLGNSLSFAMWAGAASVYMTGRPTPARTLEKINQHRPTLLFSVPTLYNMMLADERFEATDFSSIRLSVSAAEPLPPDVLRRFHDATGVELLDGIGSTEMLHIYCSNRAGDVSPGSSGTPVPGYELEIRSEEGVIDGDGESGELFVKGESALSYYWHQQAKTRAALWGEWFATGDRYRRHGGRYFYEGRIDDMLKVAGLWVSPIEIENRLMEHDKVIEAAVVAVIEDGLTRTKAFVIAAGEVEDALSDELRDFCKQTLQRHQYPHQIEFVDDLPRTATGKVQRFKLRDR